MDGAWRAEAVRQAALPLGGAALDVGTGTGDLALAVCRARPDALSVGVDYTPAMIARAPAKAWSAGGGQRVSWAVADGLSLPFSDAAFDAVLSAFVLRNLVDLPAAVAEMARVTRPGGRLVALEIAPDADPAWRKAFDLYFQQVVPRLGRLVAGDAAAYAYLPRSVAAFLDRGAVAALMRDAGLEPLPGRRLLRGAIAVHASRRPERR
jgi:demethylmenaquinone methyltransferase/2-methoxy-6-polyprenyl-1,4-benzoquinol methylase